MSTPLRALDRFRGCLLGGAVGDALGAPVEFMTLAQIRERFGAEGITGLAEGLGARRDHRRHPDDVVHGGGAGWRAPSARQTYPQAMVACQPSCLACRSEHGELSEVGGSARSWKSTLTLGLLRTRARRSRCLRRACQQAIDIAKLVLYRPPKRE